MPAKFLLEAITLYEKFYELGETIGADAEDLDKIGKVIKKLRQYRENLIWKSEIKTILNQYKSKQFFPSEKPKADFKWSPNKPKVNKKIRFTDKSTDPDGEIVKWQWDFGDGSTSAQQNPSHKYSSPGTYQVCLTVADNHQAKDKTCHDIPVAPSNISSEINFDHLSDYNPDVGDTLTVYATIKNTGNTQYRFVVGMSIGKKGQTTWHDTDIYNDPNNSKLCKIPGQPENAYVCIKLDPGKKGIVYRKFYLDPSKNPKAWSDIWITVKDKDLNVLDQKFIYDKFLVGSITEKASIERAGPQNPAEVSFANSRVTQLKLEVNKPVQDETVSVRETATGEIKQDPPGLVYRFIDLESTIADENINSVTLTFKVSKSWLERVNSTKNEVAIQKFDPVNREWRKLSTRFIEESGNDLIFKANSKGLSTYAITSTAQPPSPNWSKSGILPSPVTKGTATLHIEGQFDQVTLMIFTLSYPAQKIFEGTYYTNDAKINLSGLDNGIYLYVLITKKSGNVKKSPIKKLLLQK